MIIASIHQRFFRAPVAERAPGTMPSTQRCNCNCSSMQRQQQQVVTPPRIDVADCLARVDDLLLASPVGKNGRMRQIRLQTGPTNAAAKRSLFADADGEPDGEQEDASVLLVPVEILLQILAHLPMDALGSLRRVCRRCVPVQAAYLYVQLCALVC